MPYKYEEEDFEKVRNRSTSVNSVIFFGIFSVVLTIIFSVLRLAEVISWSWIWVLSPILIYLSIAILAFIAVIGLYILAFRDYR